MISVEKVSKTIKGKRILDNLTFSVNKGECVALIGPNGAGKTSLLSLLLGDLKTSEGSVLIDHHPPKATWLKGKIAVLQQENTIPKSVKVKELIQFFREIAKRPLTEETIDSLLGFTAEQKNQLADKLSGGQRRLLSFVLILINQTDLLFLDEPTAGMDTSTRRRFWEIIATLKKEGKTIIYTSHYIEEVEDTAERILILNKGQLVKDTTPYALGNAEQEKEFVLPKSYLELVEKSTVINSIIAKKDSIRFRTYEIEEVWAYLQENGVSISEIQIQNKSLLETLFEQTKEEV